MYSLQIRFAGWAPSVPERVYSIQILKAKARVPLGLVLVHSVGIPAENPECEISWFPALAPKEGQGSGFRLEARMPGFGGQRGQ